MESSRRWGMQPYRAKTARVELVRTCNQGCEFCDRRRPKEARDFVALEATRSRIRNAAKGAGTLVLTGGEPTMRRDLAELVQFARGETQEDATLVLETNGSLLDEERAEALKRAGLSLARVHVPAFGPVLDEITRAPGGWKATLAGIRALSRAGIPIEVATPLVRDNAAFAPLIPEALLRAKIDATAMVLFIPFRAPNPETLLPLNRAARVLERVEAEARKKALALRLDPHTFVPPCLFGHPARVAHLFAMTPGGRSRDGYNQRPECSDCSMCDRCPGPPDDTGAEVVLRPIREDRIRRRLSIIHSTEAQVARELQQDEIQRMGQVSRLVRTVRINFRCNQACRFCFVSTHLPSAPDADIERAIDDAASEGAALVLSGGEPTLNPALERLVHRAKTKGAASVEVQTNATRIDAERAARLKTAGVDLLFVSLHASKAEISDKITGAPGTFEKTLKDIDAAVGAQLKVKVNFVFCASNYLDFPDFVTMVVERWPGVDFSVSFVAASTDMVPRDKDLMPTYTEVIPSLSAGLSIAHAAQTPVSGFDSMCGIPLCLVPEDIRAMHFLAEVPQDYSGGEMHYPPSCDGCTLRGKCFGIRTGYVALHGTAELRPVTSSVAQAK